MTSQLHRYFLCSQQLSHLCYEEYFEQFVLYPYNKDEMLTERDFLEKEKVGVVRKKATRRTHGNKVVCIDTVPIRTGELFYLRTLLIH